MANNTQQQKVFNARALIAQLETMTDAQLTARLYQELVVLKRTKPRTNTPRAKVRRIWVR